jgi:hypothetical protein
MLPCMHSLHVFQILNYYTSRQELDPGFGVLDNSANERPDWYEYWPIRKYLRTEPLDENAFYGFLSPKFLHKTNLTSAMVREFVEAVQPADVILFSPSIQNSAYFLNVFEHGESEHPGLMGVAMRLFERIGRPGALKDLVSDSRNTVHANYFIAKPRFWRAWLAVTEALYSIAEAPDDPLGEELRAPTSYRGQSQVQMKIFIMERVATWIIATDRSLVARARDPFVARSRSYKLPVAIICDALKIAYVTEGRAQYKEVFFLVSGLRKYLNAKIRAADWLGMSRVRPYLHNLRSYWRAGERP